VASDVILISPSLCPAHSLWLLPLLHSFFISLIA